jgi:hypothetical protein
MITPVTSTTSHLYQGRNLAITAIECNERAGVE